MTQDSNPDIWGIVKKGLIMLSLALGSLALSVVVGYIFSRLSSRFSALDYVRKHLIKQRSFRYKKLMPSLHQV